MSDRAPVDRPSDDVVSRVLVRVGLVHAYCLAAALVYAIDRTANTITAPEADPLAAVRTARIPYFWRVALACFLASLLTSAWAAYSRRQPTAALLRLHRYSPWLFAACAIASVIWP